MKKFRLLNEGVSVIDGFDLLHLSRFVSACTTTVYTRIEAWAIVE
jgi:hypothetical protein